MKRPKCASAKCRKRARHEDGLCDDCHAKAGGNGLSEVPEAAQEYPIDVVLRMTDLESARLAAMDAELRNDLQTIRVADLELEKLERDHRENVQRRQLQKAAVVAQVERRRRDYETFVRDLAARHGLEPTKMSYDTDTGVLRDLREPIKENQE